MSISIASALKAAQSRYDIGDILGASRLEGGEWKTLYRLDTGRGPFVLSLCHPSATIESIAWEHAFLRYLAARLPQAPAPIEAHDGGTFFIHAGRIISLLPFMPGQVVDASDSRPQAAQLLAQYHRAASSYPNHGPRPSIPALRDFSAVITVPGAAFLDNIKIGA